MTVKITLDGLSKAELAPAVTAHFDEPRSFVTGTPPRLPGAYLWVVPPDDFVGYIGSAADLAARLRDYRRWLDGYKPDEEWEVTVVHMIKIFGGTVWWMPTSTHDDALVLEQRLIEWYRARAGFAPPFVGWEAKKNSKRHAAQEWARTLWNKEHPFAEEGA
ncbi:GIY-YIG nuclease family protein [Planosporangium thailandense]|uniref:GIY-YIG nuclease family protein n=1 Tax=Planosporangium thailandense TaxID=765197 RepID=A0ABX0Y245_9ACTN|nr:GIY-YIG nuclease family protein [Planosporangium thailandense]NJC72420.1 GIY-YIG nuclease family protein [Planosporangium thailandense]